MMTIRAMEATPWRRQTRRHIPLAAIWRYLGLWRDRLRQRRDLQELDAQLLRDIGVSRADVEIECNKPFWRA